MRSLLMIFMIFVTSGALTAQETERRMALTGVGQVFVAPIWQQYQWGSVALMKKRLLRCE